MPARDRVPARSGRGGAPASGRRPADAPRGPAPDLLVVGTVPLLARVAGGLLLLAGLLGLAYVAFATPIITNLLAPAPTAVVEPPPTPSPTPGPTNTAVVQVLLPDFVGKMESDVVAQLQQLGLRRGVIGPPVNNPSPAGTVIEQDPAPNTRVAQGSEVKILVSLGPAAPTAAPATPTVPPATPTTAPATVQLPNLTGQPFEAARAALEAAGFTVQRQDQPSRSVPAGSIISQTPPPGDVNRGATVTLVVSQGDLVTFPAVIGLDRAEAEARIRGTEGLNLVQVDEQGPDRLDNFENLRPNQVVSATANGEPVENGALVPRGAQIVLGVRQP